MRRVRNQRGYSMAEMITIVAILGIITAVGIPAFMQVLPQYRMRAATAEIASAMRLARQNAITMRRPWRLTFDATNEQYAISMLNSPTAAMTTAANWTKIGENGRRVVGNGAWWKPLTGGMQISTSDLRDVDCDGNYDVIFTRDGSVATNFNNGCATGGTAAIDFGTVTPKVRMHFATTLVPFNTFYIKLGRYGYITTESTKE